MQAMRRFLPLMLVLATLMPAVQEGFAQVRSGATLTVRTGAVGVLKANGSPISPATSGLTLDVGDQIGTTGNGAAVVTFFDGSEIEMGANTTIVIREASGQGARSNITVESVVGSTVHRVISLTDPGSTYRVEAGGTVGLVRGTLFGHRVEPHGDVTVALAGCGLTSDRSTEQCLEFPRPGQFMIPGQVRTATARGDIITDSFSSNVPLFDVIADPVREGNTPSGTENPGLSTGSRNLSQSQSQQQGDEKDKGAEATPTPPSAPTPGQTTLTANAPHGSRVLQVASQLGFAVGDVITIGAPGNQEVGQISGFGSIILASPTGRDHQSGEPVVKTGSVASPTPTNTPVPTPTSTVAPAPTGTVPCNNVTNSGGAGVTTTVHNLGRTSGSFPFFRNAFGVPDRFEVIYEGNVILDTGSVSGSATHSVTFGPGSSTVVTVRVTGPSGTAWTYTVNCPD